MTKSAFAAITAALMLSLSLAMRAQDINSGIARMQSGDHAGALRELMPFAERGNATAQNLVGIIHAYVWVDVAAANGNGDAPGVRQIIAESLSDTDLTLAGEISLRCREQGYQYCVR